MPTLQVNEIFHSLQGESTYAGRPCVFIRLTGCNLRCSYCDTADAYTAGKEMPLEAVLRKVDSWDCPLVEVTGGEPLLQKASLALMKKLCDRGKTVLLETNGSQDISRVDRRVIRIMDLKCPSSGEAKRNRMANLRRLRKTDEIKFVIGTRKDFEWARDCMRKYRLADKVRSILFSPVSPRLKPRWLAEWILKEKLPVRFQLQLHKLIWGPGRRGV